MKIRQSPLVAAVLSCLVLVALLGGLLWQPGNTLAQTPPTPSTPEVFPTLAVPPISPSATPTATATPTPGAPAASPTPNAPKTPPATSPAPVKSPAPVGTVLANRPVITGTFYIVAGGNTPLYFLADAAGTIYLLDIAEDLLQQAGGVWNINRKEVSVSAPPSTNNPRVSAQPILTVSSIQLLSPPVPGGGTVAPIITGSRPFVNILCKFSDVTVEPQPLSYFNGLMSDTYPGLNHYFKTASYNNIDLNGSLSLNWAVLPQPRSYYIYGSPLAMDFQRISQDCTRLADNQINFNNYQGINLMFNADLDGAAWGGCWYLNLDGTSKCWPLTWEPEWGYESHTVMAHEMGHAFGMPHSASVTGVEYANAWDVMGDGWLNCAKLTHPTYGCLGQNEIAQQKTIPGWIAAGRIYTQFGGSNSIYMERLTVPGADGYLMAKVPINGSSTRYYSIEARKYVSYDQKLPGEGIVIHQVDTTRGLQAWIQNTGNPTNNNDPGTWLVPGESFTDNANGISIVVNSSTASGYNITISSPPIYTDLILNGATLTGNINEAGKELWYRVQVNAPGLVMFETVSGTLNDNYMYLYGANSTTNLLAEDDDSGQGAAAKIVRDLAAGTYYLRVRAYFGSDTGTFTIRALNLSVGQGSSCQANFVAAYNRNSGNAWGHPTDVVKEYASGTKIYWQPLSLGAALFQYQPNGTDCEIRAYHVRGNVYSNYVTLGAGNSWLGAPTSDEFGNTSGLFQTNFVNGYITSTGTIGQATAWPNTFAGWKTTYFNAPNLKGGQSLLRSEGSSGSLNFSYDNQWQPYNSPFPNHGVMFASNWSASWERSYTFTPGSYRYRLCGDDGIRLYLNNTLVIDEWHYQGRTCYYYPSASSWQQYNNTSVALKIEYMQIDGGQTVDFGVEQLQPPAAPTNLTATLSSDYGYGVNLSWNGSPPGNPTDYVVERKVGAGGNWTQIGTVNYTAYFDKINLVAGQTHYYRVKGYNTAGSSVPSNEASVTIPLTPAKPTALLANALSLTQINLVWLDYALNEIGYSLERREPGGSWTEVAVLPPGSVRYTDNDLQPTTTYEYRLRASSTAGYSDYSNIVNGRTLVDEWLWSNPQKPAFNMSSVRCPQADMCYALGDVGQVFKTTNGGRNWQVLATGFTEPLKALSCPTPEICYILGGIGYTGAPDFVIKTSDGGVTWANLSINTSASSFYEISCPSSNVCYILAYNYDDQASVALKTTDGSTWIPTQVFTSKYISALSCPTTLTCYAAGSDLFNMYIWKTVNGTNWISQTLIPTGSFATYSLDCPSALVCYSVGVGGSVAKTTNGSTWTISQPISTSYLFDVKCTSTTECFTLTEKSTVFKTSNGDNWTTSYTLPNGNPSLNNIACAFNLSSKCYIVGQSGQTITTDNGGTSWQNWYNNTTGFSSSMRDISCLNTKLVTCFAVGSGKIYKTIDSGQTWQEQSGLSSNQSAARITCVNTGICYVVGQTTANPATGFILKTINGGASWVALNLPSGIPALFDISCASNVVCYAVGEYHNTTQGATILKTLDGTNWALQNPPANLAKLSGIHCPSVSNCWAVWGSNIAKTTNGSTWTSQSTPSADVFNLNRVYCQTSQVCVAVGGGSKGGGGAGSIIRTSDGANWSVITARQFEAYNTINCTSGTSECFIASDSNLLRSSDGGISWQKLNPPDTSRYTYHIGADCPVPTFCFLLSSNGEILKQAMLVHKTEASAGSYSLAEALVKAKHGQTILLRPFGSNTINIGAAVLPAVPEGAILSGSCSPNGPAVTLSGTGAGGPGLVLGGSNSVFGLHIRNFLGLQLTNSGTNNKLSCVRASN